MELKLNADSTCLIDECDLWILNFGKPHFDGRYVRIYLMSRWHNGPRRYEYLHRLIAGRVDGGKKIVVDHINRNPLDNRRENLRIVPVQINSMNRCEQFNKHGLFGVRFVKHSKNGSLRKKPWRSEIKIDGVNKFLGYFKTKEEAHTAAKAAREKRWDDYPSLP